MSDHLLLDAIDEINKLYGSSTIFKTGGKIKLEIDAISTGSLEIDEAIGIGGIPKGRITLISGPESSGKSLLALSIVKSAQKEGGVGVYLDSEYSLTDSWLSRVGIDFRTFLVSQNNNAVKSFELLIGRKSKQENSKVVSRTGGLLQNQSLLKAGLSVIVVDSLDALIPPLANDGTEEDTTMAGYLTFALKRIPSLLFRTNVALVVICHPRIRFKDNRSFESIGGGQALKDVASVWIELSCIEDSVKKDENDNIVEQQLSVYIRKNRVSDPFHKTEVVMSYKDRVELIKSKKEN